MAAAEQMIYQPIETAPVKMWQLKINQNWSETLQDNNSALWLEGGIYTSSPTGGSVLKRTCCSVQVTGDTLEKSDRTEDTRGKKKEELKGNWEDLWSNEMTLFPLQSLTFPSPLPLFLTLGRINNKLQ